jgi:hypothetical protein
VGERAGGAVDGEGDEGVRGDLGRARGVEARDLEEAFTAGRDDDELLVGLRES